MFLVLVVTNMKTVYQRAQQSVLDMVYEVMRSYHPDLDTNDVKVAVTMVSKFDADDNEFHALKHHGAEANATIKCVSAKRRVHVDHDLEMDIDGLFWRTATAAQQRALIDHELTHVIVVKDEKGQPKRNDLDHIRLRLRPDEWTLTGFACVIERHGLAATEASASMRVNAIVVRALEHAARVAGQNVAAMIPASASA